LTMLRAGRRKRRRSLRHGPAPARRHDYLTVRTRFADVVL
jgi:hypothetical protein